MVPGGVMQATVTITSKPIIEIGIKEETDTTRTILMKFRGSADQDFWSGGGTYDNPSAVVVAELPVSDECFEMDSLDLARVCEQCVKTNGDPISTLILQREELCGDKLMIGVGSEGGMLSEDDCPVECPDGRVDGSFNLFVSALAGPTTSFMGMQFPKGPVDANGISFPNITSTEDGVILSGADAFTPDTNWSWNAPSGSMQPVVMSMSNHPEGLVVNVDVANGEYNDTLTASGLSITVNHGNPPASYVCLDGTPIQSTIGSTLQFV
jgi:hypothetical protein